MSVLSDKNVCGVFQGPWYVNIRLFMYRPRCWEQKGDVVSKVAYELGTFKRNVSVIVPWEQKLAWKRQCFSKDELRR